MGLQEKTWCDTEEIRSFKLKASETRRARDQAPLVFADAPASLGDWPHLDFVCVFVSVYESMWWTGPCISLSDVGYVAWTTEKASPSMSCSDARQSSKRSARRSTTQKTRQTFLPMSTKSYHFHHPKPHRPAADRQPQVCTTPASQSPRHLPTSVAAASLSCLPSLSYPAPQYRKTLGQLREIAREIRPSSNQVILSGFVAVPMLDERIASEHG